MSITPHKNIHKGEGKKRKEKRGGAHWNHEKRIALKYLDNQIRKEEHGSTIFSRSLLGYLDSADAIDLLRISPIPSTPSLTEI